MSYNRITAEDIAGKGVVGQADTPLLSALEMQNKVEEVPRAVIIPHFNSLIDSLDKRDADVDTALSHRYTKTETDNAIARTVTEIGAGDMQKAVYDTDGDGVVDNAQTAADARKLAGKTPGQLTFGADQIITDEATDKRLPETIEEKMPAKNIAYNAETIDSLTTFAMRNTTSSATDSLSVACKAAYGTALWFMFSIAQTDACVQYAFPYGTKNGFLMRNYNWWTKSWSRWESVVPASGGAFTGTAQARSDTRTITYSPGELVNTSVRDSSGNAVSTRFLIMIRK